MIIKLENGEGLRSIDKYFTDFDHFGFALSFDLLKILRAALKLPFVQLTEGVQILDLLFLPTLQVQSLVVEP